MKRERLRQETPLTGDERVPEATRLRAFRASTEAELLVGATLVSPGDYSVVLSYPRPVSHWNHGIATFLTGGLWAVVWVVMAIARRDDRVRLVVDVWRHVWPEETMTPKLAT